MHADQRKCLDRLFSPESLALMGFFVGYGAIDGRFFLTNLQRADFPGRLYLVDPIAREVNGIRVYPNISALPEAIGLAMICAPTADAPSVLSECARKEIRNIHLITIEPEKARIPRYLRLGQIEFQKKIRRKLKTLTKMNSGKEKLNEWKANYRAVKGRNDDHRHTYSFLEKRLYT